MRAKLSALLFCGLFLSASLLQAHPMGNFSINHHSTIHIRADGASIRYILDFAEIPTFQMRGEISPELWLRGLKIDADGVLRAIQLNSSRRDLSPGAGGLSTMKVTLDLSTTWDAPPTTLHFQDSNFADRIGWKEIVIESDGSIGFPAGNPYSQDRSNGLSDYAPDLLSTAPAVVEATVKTGPPDSRLPIKVEACASCMPAGLGLAGQASKGDARLSAILTSQTLAWNVVAVGCLIAFALGALHALSPGHGKTIVAAYLVGNRGTSRHALFLGAIVTLTHTIGVFALGLVTLFLSRYIVPERLYPVLGFASGAMIVGIGFKLFRQRFHVLTHHHADAQGHDHDHTHNHTIPVDLTWRRLVGFGVSGGIVPCPSALVVLLSAVALHRIATGMFLIVAFSFGLASVLIAIGILAVHAGRLLGRFDGNSGVARVLPVISAAAVTVIGIGIAIQSLSGTTLAAPAVPLGSGALFVLGLGLVLGLKHATDADHIVAVTTFVSEQRSILRSCSIGALWGLGHTLSLALAGVIVIGLRIGISEWVAARLEFLVAVMLVGLGLRAVLQTSKASAVHSHSHTPGLRPLFVGMVHGAAGSAALMLLVLSTIQSPIEAFLYILIFGIGSIAGMLAISFLISIPLHWASGRMAASFKPIQLTAGLFSCMFGLYLGVHLWTSL